MTGVLGASIGNLIEWYDWYTYAAFALYFSHRFFPDSDPTAQLLNTSGIFAVGFFMRPVGAWLFGRIADKQGRKNSMTVSILLMSFGSLLIAVTPDYSSIGVLAPVVLFLARLIQGLSAGGEYGSSATYLSEMALSHRRRFYSSFQYVTLIGGQLIALSIQLILQNLLLTQDELFAWGWRIPFAIGTVLSLVVFYIRRNLDETPAFTQIKVDVPHRGNLPELLKYRRSIMTVVGLTLGGTIAFYTFSIYMQKFLVNTVHLSIRQSTSISFSTLAVFALLQPVFGLLSDRVGRKPILIFFGVAGTICTVPILTVLSQTHSITLAYLLPMLGLVIVSGYTSINAIVKAELFPSEIRALGVGLPYAITVAIFGGTAEYIALWFKKLHHEDYFFWHVSLCILISLVSYVRMKDSSTQAFMSE